MDHWQSTLGELPGIQGSGRNDCTDRAMCDHETATQVYVSRQGRPGLASHPLVDASGFMSDIRLLGAFVWVDGLGAPQIVSKENTMLANLLNRMPVRFQSGPAHVALSLAVVLVGAGLSLPSAATAADDWVDPLADDKDRISWEEVRVPVIPASHGRKLCGHGGSKVTYPRCRVCRLCSGRLKWRAPFGCKKCTMGREFATGPCRGHETCRSDPDPDPDRDPDPEIDPDADPQIDPDPETDTSTTETGTIAPGGGGGLSGGSGGGGFSTGSGGGGSLSGLSTGRAAPPSSGVTRQVSCLAVSAYSAPSELTLDGVPYLLEGPSLAAGDGQVTLGLPVVRADAPLPTAWVYKLGFYDARANQLQCGPWTEVPESLVIDGLDNFGPRAQPGSHYVVSVQAVNRVGSSPPSGAVSARPSMIVPAAPSSLQARLGTTGMNSDILLTWDESEDEGVLGYQYRYRSYSADDGSHATSVWHNIGLVTDQLVLRNRWGYTYLFELRAIADGAHGAISTVNVFPRLPGKPSLAPSGFVATWDTANEVNLRWDVAADPSLRYEYRYSEDDGSSWADWVEALADCGSDTCDSAVPVYGIPGAYLFELRRYRFAHAAHARTGPHPDTPRAPVLEQVVMNDASSWQIRWTASTEGVPATAWQYRSVMLGSHEGALWSEWGDMQPTAEGSGFSFVGSYPEDAPTGPRMIQVRGTNGLGGGVPSNPRLEVGESTE